MVIEDEVAGYSDESENRGHPWIDEIYSGGGDQLIQMNRGSPQDCEQ
jgi:hypothetical protein